MGLILCCLYIGHVWKKFFTGFYGSLSYDTLRCYAALDPMYPSDPGLRSLQWSASRHAAVFLISATLIYFANVQWLNSVLLLLNCLYALLSVWHYIVRRKRMVNAGSAREAIAIAMKACITVPVYAVLLQVALYAVYFYRP